MKYRITAPAMLKTSVKLPASKSISNRALILNALSCSPFEIANLSDCDDTKVMVEALNSGGRDFDIRGAGTAMRFLTAFFAGTAGEWTVTGTERMRNRPIRILVDALNASGACIGYIGKEGFPPLRISGRALQGGGISLSGSVSSQYISALLMVAPLMERGLTLHLEGDVISKPYIRLTLQLMARYGVQAIWEGADIRVRPQHYTPVPLTVESDWSAASYWYEAAALSPGAEIGLQGLFKDSLQGDAAVASLFAQLGVGTTYTRHGIVVRQTGNRAEKLHYDFIDEPDLVQTFAVTCAMLGMPFRFTGLQSLRIKETDRIEALKTELHKLGYLLADSGTGVLAWDGRRCEPEADPVIETYEDHRMAMAFAPVALVRKEGIGIAAPQVVSKSYPHFWDDLQSAGFGIGRQTANEE